MNTKRAGILIVTRNGLGLTRRTIRTALDQEHPSSILVVDNHSSDGTVSWLMAQDRISYVALNEQVSLAACWNRGLRTFWKSGFDSVLVLNNDVEIRQDTLGLLLAHSGEFVTAVSVDSPDRLGAPGDRWIDDLRAII